MNKNRNTQIAQRRSEQLIHSMRKYLLCFSKCYFFLLCNLFFRYIPLNGTKKQNIYRVALIVILARLLLPLVGECHGDQRRK